jgi:hypothetical protein
MKLFSFAMTVALSMVRNSAMRQVEGLQRSSDGAATGKIKRSPNSYRRKWQTRAPAVRAAGRHRRRQQIPLAGGSTSLARSGENFEAAIMLAAIIMRIRHFPQGRTAISQYDLERQYGSISVRDAGDIKADVPACDYVGTAMKREDGGGEVIYFKMYDVGKKTIFSHWWVPTEETMYDGLLCLARKKAYRGGRKRKCARLRPLHDERP